MKDYYVSILSTYKGLSNFHFCEHYCDTFLSLKNVRLWIVYLIVRGVCYTDIDKLDVLQNL